MSPAAWIALGAWIAASPGDAPGGWALFRAEAPGRPALYLRAAIVGEEVGEDGVRRQWLEIELGTEPSLQAPLGRIAALVDPSRKAAVIQRLVVGAGIEPPAEISTALLQPPPAPTQPRTRSGPGPEISVGPPQPVTTPAGTVEARRVEVRSEGKLLQRLWIGESVPVVPLVRLEAPPTGHVLALVAFGHGAAPRVKPPP